MSTLYDTLTYDGSEKSFAAWGFSYDTTDELGNQKADVFTATIVGADISTEGDTPTFPFEAPIIVRTNRTSSTGGTNSFSGGSITFSGKRVGNPAKCTGKYEGVTYKFQGPWYDLSNTHFLQVFYGESDDGDNVSYLLPELVLNSSTAVTSGQILISVGDQIQAILQWLLDQYAAQGFSAPYQYIGRALDAGAINLNSTDEVYDYLVNESTTTIDYSLFALFLPSYIAKPMTCADAIQKCLQFSPRVTCSFDYSTSPPTFHAALVDTMTPVSLPLFDGVSHTSVNIQVRDDLLVRCVNIMYRSTYQVNGVTEVQYELDKWGPNGSNSSLDPDSGLRVPLPPKQWEPSLQINEICEGVVTRASELRSALIPLLLRQHSFAGSQAEFETAGIEDYAKAFGHVISARHWRELFMRTVQRDGGAENWNRLEIYLPDRLRKKDPSAKRVATELAEDFAELESYIMACRNPHAPSKTERQGIWTLALEKFASLVSAGESEKSAARRTRQFLFDRASFLAASRDALLKAFNYKLDAFKNAGGDAKALRDGRKGNGQRFELPDADRDLLIHRHPSPHGEVLCFSDCLCLQ